MPNTILKNDDIFVHCVHRQYRNGVLDSFYKELKGHRPITVAQYSQKRQNGNDDSVSNLLYLNRSVVP